MKTSLRHAHAFNKQQHSLFSCVLCGSAAQFGSCDRVSPSRSDLNRLDDSRAAKGVAREHSAGGNEIKIDLVPTPPCKSDQSCSSVGIMFLGGWATQGTQTYGKSQPTTTARTDTHLDTQYGALWPCECSDGDGDGRYIALEISTRLQPYVAK